MHSISSYFNPFSKEHHALADAKNNSFTSNVVVCLGAVVAGCLSLGLGIVPAFRFLVGRFSKHSQATATTTTTNTQTTANDIFNTEQQKTTSSPKVANSSTTPKTITTPPPVYSQNPPSTETDIDLARPISDGDFYTLYG